MGISKHDKQALADLFINMGVPLVVAIQTLESWSGGEPEPQTVQAEKLAKLLNVSVDFATKLTKKLEIRDAYTLENVRGKIIRIVTPIIADFYIKNGQTPTSDNLQSLTDLFDVLLSFADSVSPTDDKGSKPTKMAAMIEACDPLLNVIRDHNLHEDEASAFNEAVDGLKTRADQLAPALGMDNAVESGLFRSVVKIYTSCYELVAKRGGTFDDVWGECDHRLALIHGLTVFVADKTGIAKGEIPKAAKPQTDKSSSRDKEDASKADEKIDIADIVKDDEDVAKPDIFKLNTKPDKPSEKDVGGEKKSGEGEDEDDFNPMAFFSSNG